ncbi:MULTISPECIES: YkgJ family cysteine cluster protein [Mesorhizobium]|uniref:Fe-S-cluster containining protein n=1 Tax=Mesorhizobium shonense TaxID=1209948 RepID=A0ABV2I3P6_9HYPH|nr:MULTISPECIES: YkgJ family cysteine cluster protein [unclassified Mesorhizobium]AZO30775.1 YkgJ family cysteine cluster protein [Mesorhizobium sp. M1B.F.Ca.ET.045.04.1.1]RWA67423.1 MAG: YkgJ family cysteine cluster protein [Mesorhizobium sp.]RWA78780.1 MAG: YkgJ family cysteine cluster protein [Mesorhizobium sp.]RWB22183.1 MAG: YkgJ family cysteine cluster protein [Mesorhizobium sp.]RWD96838.1 MAG: YkgJ family cysteine cluster protein [Mesorhizobium sp.]
MRIALPHDHSFLSLTDASAAFDCQSCGACCAYSADWPRFSTEEDAELDRIPEALVAADQSGMHCEGSRCSALCGEVGKGTACTIYEVRPHVCRACMPGGDDCLMARAMYGLAVESVISPLVGVEEWSA